MSQDQRLSNPWYKHPRFSGRERMIDCNMGVDTTNVITNTAVAGTGATTQNAAGYWATLNSAANADETQVQLKNSPFYLDYAGGFLEQLWEFQIVDGSTAKNLQSFGIGMSIIDTTLYGGRSDSVLFKRTSGNNYPVVEVYGASAAIDSQQCQTAVIDNNWHTLAFRYELVSLGSGKVTVHLDGVLQYTSATPIVMPLSTVLLNESWYVKNGEAVAKGLNIRRIYTYKEEA